MKQRTKIMLAGGFILLVFLPFAIMNIKTKDASGKASNREFEVQEGFMSQGSALGDLLAAQGIGPSESYAITNALKDVFNVRRCRVGDRWEVYLDKEGNFVKFIYYDGPMDFYIVEADREKNSYSASACKVDAERRIRGVEGSIMSSLYESMSSVNVPPELVIHFAEIFASKIDFFTDCRTGDEFHVLWDAYLDKNGNVLKDNRIFAASYTRGEETYYAFYFEPEGGKGGYYDQKGESVETAFLKAPLNYRRISSHFTYRRLHPIYKVYRPHLGIDYAAPAGTPVSSIGDGVVRAAGRRKDGLGITVVVKHPNNYVSWYGHLSRVARGISRGGRVRKGQVIGYVGSTGVSTGPHLDFRIQKNGKFVNFLALKLPPSHPLPEEHRKEFEIVKGMLMDMQESLDTENVVVFKNHAIENI